jgi:DNA topoisomerase-1
MPAVFDATAIEISAGTYGFGANGQMLKFDGFLKVYPMKFSENDLPALQEKEVLNLKEFKPYNYFDETKKECNNAMDKIIELYKENEHGEELVKDIEKVYGMNHVSPRAKEFLKHGISMIKGQ